MRCNPQAFVDNLPYMGQGMLAIMVVMLVIIGVTLLLGHLPGKE